MKKQPLGIRMAILLVLPAFLAGQAGTLEAAQTGSVAVKVTITNLSVSVSPATLTLPNVSVGGTVVSGSGIVATNDGNVNETLSLNLTNPAGWTASGTAPGAEIYVLNGAFDADGLGITWAEANHAITTTPVSSSATKFAGDQNGTNIAAGINRTLWFQFKAPTSTSVTTQQTINVTVTASLV